MSRKYKERRGFSSSSLDSRDREPILIHAVSRGRRYKKQFAPSELILLFHRNALFTVESANDDDEEERKTMRLMKTFQPLFRHIFSSSLCASCVHAIDFSGIKGKNENDEKTSKQLHNILKRVNVKDRAIAIAFGSKESLVVLRALMQHDKMESVVSVVLMNPVDLSSSSSDGVASGFSGREFMKACQEIREEAIGEVKVFVVLSARGEEYNREKEIVERSFSETNNSDGIKKDENCVSVLVKSEGAKLGEAVADAVRERDSSSENTIEGLSNRVDEWILETEKAADNYAELFVSKITFEHNKYDKQIEQICVECTEKYSETLGNKEKQEEGVEEIDEEVDYEEEPPPVVYLARRPFDSRKLFLMLKQEYGNVSFTEDLNDDDENGEEDANESLLASSLRSQGVVWVNSRLTTPLQWLHKRSEPVRVYAVDEKPWFNEHYEDDEKDEEQEKQALLSLFQRKLKFSCGDRRNHLVFEGVKDAEKLREMLDSCLCDYDVAEENDDAKEDSFMTMCQQVWESVSYTMERCGVIAEGRGGAGCVALMQQKEKVTMKTSNTSSFSTPREKEDEVDVEEEKSFGGKIGVLVPEAFLRPTKQQGETKVFTSSENKITRTGHYFPKMPCLTCGSPWWIGDGGWNSTCANCGDDDRCYGLDQMPLRQFRGKHRKFCELVLKMNVDS